MKTSTENLTETKVIDPRLMIETILEMKGTIEITIDLVRITNIMIAINLTNM